MVRGEIASGDQVVDDPTNDFFAQVLKAWPRINAVEMEGAGAAAAIELAKSQGIPTRFMMIRGISDLSRAKGKNKGTKERDAWKAYASDAAAAFVMGWISYGLPSRLRLEQRICECLRIGSGCSGYSSFRKNGHQKS